ncbi:hypothetical protein EJMOOK_08535 [Rhodanobacter sp. Root179]|uniref:hypothetical protein n=1 Tax=Rhodanobacter sp. Root179 TaxID=1736482 RepID=UPI0006FF5DB3|nr:hypothetical protein [Rhodanobacter sp. Root179]KRB34865.1 hypothetical protein ASD82_15125 [Rhodanobacter sp. Root179]
MNFASPNISSSSRRFEQQIVFLSQASGSGYERLRESQRSINQIRGTAFTGASEIANLKAQFTQWTGKPYSRTRTESDSAAVKKFDREILPRLVQLERDQSTNQDRIAAMEAGIEKVHGWLTPTGRLLDSIYAYLGVRGVDSVFPEQARIPGLAYPDVSAGDKRRKKLDGIQERIGLLLVEQENMQKASVTADEFKRRMISDFDSSSMVHKLTGVYAHEQSCWPANDPLTMKDLASIFGAETIADRLFEISKGYQDAYPSVDREQRRRRLREVDAEILSLSRE